MSEKGTVIVNYTRNEKKETPTKKLYNVDGVLTTTSLLMMLIDEKVERGNQENTKKITVLHTEKDSDLAKKLVENLNKGSNFRAVAECELSVFKMMCFISYLSAAIEWADIVVVLVTESYLDDIKNVDSSIWRPSGSLQVRHGFKLLQHKFYNDNSFPIVAVVQEGMHHDCHEFMEFKKCVHFKKDFSEFEDAILQLKCVANKARTE